MNRLPELLAVLCLFGLLFGGLHVVASWLGVSTEWIKVAGGGMALGVVMNVWWQFGAIHGDVQLLRIQMNRLTRDLPSEEDRVRLETDDELNTLTEHDRKTIDGLKNLRWAEEHPEEMAALNRDLVARGVLQPPLKNA